MNYFELYDIHPSLHLNQNEVKKKFYELSRKFHPDFFINESEEKQQEVLELSTLNNKAYQTLSNPDKLIEYVLSLYGEIKEGEKYSLPQSFLMEMMEVNEVLMEMDFEPDATKLSEVENEIQEIEKKLYDELQVLSASFEGENTDVLPQIKDFYYRKKYLLRIRESMNKFASRM